MTSVRQEKFKRERPRVARVAQTHDLMAKVIALRKQGHNTQKISEVLDISYGYSYRLYQMAIKRTVNEPAEEVIKIELSRLDMLLVPAFFAATQRDSLGNPVYNKDATDTVLKLMERRAKYLGLDKPVKSEAKLTLNQRAPVTIYIPQNNRDKPEFEDGIANFPQNTFALTPFHNAKQPVIEVQASELERFSDEGDFVYGVADD